jgi:Domain of unknown function (DUF4209)
MIWDQLPGAFDDAHIRAAADAALDLEKEVAEGVARTDLAEVFKKRGLSLGASELGLLLQSDGLACDLWLSDGESRNRWGPLSPSREFGGTVYPPPVTSFPDALRPYFEIRASATTRADLRARYHDLIWLRWRNFEHACQAHRGYLDAASGADLKDATSAMTAVDYLLRAADLSLTLKYREEETIAILRTEVLRGLPTEPAGYAGWLAERGAPLIARRPDIARELIDAILTETRQAPVGQRARERDLLEAAEVLARAVGDAERARSLRLEQAASFEAEAIERVAEGGIIELALLNNAVSLYGQAGAGAEVQRLKPALAAASRHADEGLHLLESKVTIPDAAIENAATDMTKRLGEKEFLALGAGDALGLWPPPERVEAALDRAMAEHPFQFLVNRTSVGSDGRYQPDPDAEPQRREARLTRQLAQDTMIRLVLGISIIDQLRRRGLWSAERLIVAVRLVDPPLADACAPGFEALEADRAWLAGHALVPQLERAVRLVAQTVGVTPMKRTSPGGLRWASFEEMLDEPAVEGALGARLSVSLKRLFLDSYGPNYRHEIAHGAADPSENQSPSAMLTALAILSVAARLAIARGGPSTEASDSPTASE